MAAPAPNFPGFTLGGVSGVGCLPPGSAGILAVLNIGDSGVASIEVPIGVPIHGLQYWFQGVFLHQSGSRRFGAGCVPVWAF